jgi:hypothetical protein
VLLSEQKNAHVMAAIVSVAGYAEYLTDCCVVLAVSTRTEPGEVRGRACSVPR